VGPALPPTPVSAVGFEKQQFLNVGEDTSGKRKRVHDSDDGSGDLSTKKHCQEQEIVDIDSLVGMANGYATFNTSMATIVQSIDKRLRHERNARERLTITIDEQAQCITTIQRDVASNNEDWRREIGAHTSELAALQQAMTRQEDQGKKAEERADEMTTMAEQQLLLFKTAGDHTNQLREHSESLDTKASITDVERFINERSRKDCKISDNKYSNKATVAKQLTEKITKADLEKGIKDSNTSTMATMTNTVAVAKEGLSKKITDLNTKMQDMPTKADIEKQANDTTTTFLTIVEKKEAAWKEASDKTVASYDLKLQDMITKAEGKKQMDNTTAIINNDMKKLAETVKAVHYTCWEDLGKTEQKLKTDLIVVLNAQCEAMGNKITQDLETTVGPLKADAALVKTYESQLNKHDERLNTYEGRLARYEERLDEVTKHHHDISLPSQQRLATLEAFRTSTTEGISDINSRLVGVDQSLLTFTNQSADFQNHLSVTAPRHSADILNLRSRVEKVEDNAVNRPSASASNVDHCPPTTPAAQVATPFTDCKSPGDRMTTVERRVDNHRNNLNQHDKRIEKSEVRLTKCENGIKSNDSEVENLKVLMHNMQSTMESMQSLFDQQVANMQAQQSRDMDAHTAIMRKRVNELENLMWTHKAAAEKKFAKITRLERLERREDESVAKISALETANHLCAHLPQIRDEIDQLGERVGAQVEYRSTLSQTEMDRQDAKMLDMLHEATTSMERLVDEKLHIIMNEKLNTVINEKLHTVIDEKLPTFMDGKLRAPMDEMSKQIRSVTKQSNKLATAQNNLAMKHDLETFQQQGEKQAVDMANLRRRLEEGMPKEIKNIKGYVHKCVENLQKAFFLELDERHKKADQACRSRMHGAAASSMERYPSPPLQSPIMAQEQGVRASAAQRNASASHPTLKAPRRPFTGDRVPTNPRAASQRPQDQQMWAPGNTSVSHLQSPRMQNVPMLPSQTNTLLSNAAPGFTPVNAPQRHRTESSVQHENNTYQRFPNGSPGPPRRSSSNQEHRFSG
jgi:hypothetical protein